MCMFAFFSHYVLLHFTPRPPGLQLIMILYLNKNAHYSSSNPTVTSSPCFVQPTDQNPQKVHLTMTEDREEKHLFQKQELESDWKSNRQNIKMSHPELNHVILIYGTFQWLGEMESN